jgi:hypothetical protein
VSSELKPGSQMLVFGVPNAQTGQGTITVVDPEGDLSCELGDRAIPGVEQGVFVQDGTGLSFSAVNIDTNGCAGISDGQSLIGPVNFTVSPDGYTMVLTLPAPDGSGQESAIVPLYRVVRQP